MAIMQDTDGKSMWHKYPWLVNMDKNINIVNATLHIL